MSNPSVAKYSFFAVLFLFSMQCVLSGDRALAQKPGNMEASVSAFAQFTGSTSGNGVSDSPTGSAGGLASFRQTLRPLLGYEVNYSYTRFAEGFSNLPFAIQDNVHEATGAYLLQGPRLLMLQPFAAVGGGMLLFLPTNTGGQQYHQQFRGAFLFEVGANYSILSPNFGIRVQYRGLFHSAPDFGVANLNTGGSRLTSEPTAGIYVRF